jgi:hypothetical protein
MIVKFRFKDKSHRWTVDGNITIKDLDCIVIKELYNKKKATVEYERQDGDSRIRLETNPRCKHVSEWELNELDVVHVFFDRPQRQSYERRAAKIARTEIERGEKELRKAHRGEKSKGKKRDEPTQPMPGLGRKLSSGEAVGKKTRVKDEKNNDPINIPGVGYRLSDGECVGDRKPGSSNEQLKSRILANDTSLISQNVTVEEHAFTDILNRSNRDLQTAYMADEVDGILHSVMHGQYKITPGLPEGKYGGILGDGTADYLDYNYVRVRATDVDVNKQLFNEKELKELAAGTYDVNPDHQKWHTICITPGSLFNKQKMNWYTNLYLDGHDVMKVVQMFCQLDIDHGQDRIPPWIQPRNMLIFPESIGLFWSIVLHANLLNNSPGGGMKKSFEDMVKEVIPAYRDWSRMEGYDPGERTRTLSLKAKENKRQAEDPELV